MTGVGVEQIAAHVGISFELRTSATASHQDIQTLGQTGRTGHPAHPG